MGNLHDHAVRELDRVRAGESLYGDLLPNAILEMVDTFADQNHSGMSAGIVIEALNKLLRFEPLAPLTGEDDEWVEVGEGTWQNNRCSRVFKDADGRTYDISGRVFVDKDGMAWTGKDSRVDVTFPYTPTTERVQRDI